MPIVLSLLDFMQRRAAVVRRVRLHSIRFHGKLAPNVGLHSAVMPGSAHKPGEHAQKYALPSAHMAGVPAQARVRCGREFQVARKCVLKEPARIIKRLRVLPERWQRRASRIGPNAPIS